MSETGKDRTLYPALALVFFTMLIVMSAYELTKQVLNPTITLWQSHAITIVFTSIVALIIVYFPLRSFYNERRHVENALRLQKEAEENLRKSEMQYRSFVESAEDSIYTVDRESRYLLINARHLARHLIQSRDLPEEYTGKRYGDFHSPAETRIFEEQVRNVIDSKSPVQDEYEREGRYYLRKLNPVIDPIVNEVIAITVISSEITERKLAEKNLATINRKLNLMTDITHHDLLNQLTVLNTLLSLAEGQAGEPATRRYLLKSEQVIDTIQNQILFARDYQNIGIESPQWQNLYSTIQRARLPLKIESVTIDEGCRDLDIYADPLLERVFYNLMENAVRYAGPQPEIRFSVTREPGRLLLACEDNGPGIRRENKEKIFERGFGKNTGLGLFLIREVLSMTGIAICENGVEGKGSRFEFFIPEESFRCR
jgi:signal transduction histidine kinase